MREKAQKCKVKGSGLAKQARLLPADSVQGEGHRGMVLWNLDSLHSAFLDTRPILVRMFRRRKKAAVLAAQITSATQKAVLQL